MAFDQNNFVSPAPGGGFVSVVNGVEQRFPDQQSAEQNFNTRSGQSNAPPGGQTYSTPNGPRTIEQIRAELQGAGYNGQTDTASLIAAYNNAASGGGAGAVAGDYGYNDLNNAVMQSNREKFEFDKRMGEEQLKLAQNADQRAAAQLKIQQAQFQLDRINSAAQTGTNLINIGANLRGPEDYFQFLAATSQGRDLFSQLYSDQPRADFGAPQGEMRPASIQSLMDRLGIDLSGVNQGSVDRALGGGTPGATSGGYQTKNGPKTLDQMKAELQGANYPGPWDEQSIIAAYGRTTGGPVTPGGTPAPGGMSPEWYSVMSNFQGDFFNKNGRVPTTQEWAAGFAAQTGLPAEIGARIREMGQAYKAQYGVGPPQDMQEQWIRQLQSGTAQPAPGSGAPGPGQVGLPAIGPALTRAATQPLGGNQDGPFRREQPFAARLGMQPLGGNRTGLSVPGTGQTVPFAHQVNPGVFDAMGPVGQGLLRSAVESSGFDWNEYLRQQYASRPQGTAPRRTQTQYAMPAGIFG